MLNAVDRENLEKSSQTANLLVQDLCELTKANDPLLAEKASDALQQATLVEQRLREIESTLSIKA